MRRTALVGLLVVLPHLVPTQAAAVERPSCPAWLWAVYPFYCATGLDPWGIIIDRNGEF